METATVGEAISAAHDATIEAVAHAVETAKLTADEEVERALNEAEAQLSEAQRANETIARAAEQSHLAQAFEAFKQEIHSWLGRQETDLQKIPAMERAITEVQGQLSSLALLQQTGQSSSIPQQLPAVEAVQEATAEVAQMLPESLSESAVAESPVPEIRKPRNRWI